MLVVQNQRQGIELRGAVPTSMPRFVGGVLWRAGVFHLRRDSGAIKFAPPPPAPVVRGSLCASRTVGSSLTKSSLQHRRTLTWLAGYFALTCFRTSLRYDATMRSRANSSDANRMGRTPFPAQVDWLEYEATHFAIEKISWALAATVMQVDVSAGVVA